MARARRHLSVCLNPVLQKTLTLESLRENEVNRVRCHRIDASGKGINVIRVLTQLGTEAALLTQAGGRNRDRFLMLAAEDGLSVHWVESGSEIRSCYTLLSQKAATCTEIVEEAVPVSEGTEDRVRDAFDELVSQHGSVIISGTKAAGFSDELYPDLVRAAKTAGARVVLDVRGPDLLRSLAYRPDVIKPNFSEFAATFVTESMPSEHVLDAELERCVVERMLELAREHGCVVVLTHGMRPTLVAEPGNGDVARVSVDPVVPLNTTGSGDAFTAGFSEALAAGASLVDAVERGHACGRENALQVRPGVIHTRER